MLVHKQNNISNQAHSSCITCSMRHKNSHFTSRNFLWQAEIQLCIQPRTGEIQLAYTLEKRAIMEALGMAVNKYKQAYDYQIIPFSQWVTLPPSYKEKCRARERMSQLLHTVSKEACHNDRNVLHSAISFRLPFFLLS